MTEALAWALAAATVAVLLAYETTLALAVRRHPRQHARSAHATLREDWFAAVSQQPGSEILAVQTLRNSLMSATMTASTAAIGLMGTASLAAPSLHDALRPQELRTPVFTPGLAMELALLALLFGSLVLSVMAVRYYTHAGFVGGMPVDSAARRAWNATGQAAVRRAGILYGWGLRQLVLVAPLVAYLLHPWAGPVAALAVVAVLWRLDRVPAGPDAPVR
jgi:hypothetical protein